MHDLVRRLRRYIDPRNLYVYSYNYYLKHCNVGSPVSFPLLFGVRTDTIISLMGSLSIASHICTCGILKEEAFLKTGFV